MFTFFWSRSASIWAAALYILLGLVLVLFPGMTGTVFCWALAIAAAVYAIGRLVRWFQGRKAGTASAADLLLGIIFLVLCLFCLLRPCGEGGGKAGGCKKCKRQPAAEQYDGGL